MSDNFQNVESRNNKRRRRFTNLSLEPSNSDNTTYLNVTMSNTEEQKVYQYTLNETDIQRIALAVKDYLQNEILSTVNQALDSYLKELSKEVNTLKNENQILRNENQELKLCIDELEQYGRRNAVRISGVPERTGENTDDIVRDIATKMGVDVCDEDISRSHRSGKPGLNRPRQILVKFTRYNLKRKIMKSRWELKKNSSSKDIFINEDLTKRRQSLYTKARQLYKEKLVNKTWTWDGKIFISDKNDKKYRIDNESDLDPFKLQTIPMEQQHNSGLSYAAVASNST